MFDNSAFRSNINGSAADEPVNDVATNPPSDLRSISDGHFVDEPVIDATLNSPNDKGDTDATVRTYVLIPNGQDVQNERNPMGVKV